MAKRDINIENIVYNQLSQAKYNKLLESGQLNPNEFYITPHEDTYDWSHMTNCFTKIPQNIKVEVNGGSLTLKKGSIVTFPNGFNPDGTERFDYVTLETDVISTPTTAWGVNTHTACLVRNNGGYGLLCRYASNMTSTPATPIAYDTYYNTTTNQIMGYDSDATTPLWGGNGEISLPICTFDVVSPNGTDRQVSTIFQVFQSMGFIGSILWTDKDVTCLIPNGRNTDGSLNNIDYTTSRCKIYNVNTYGSQTCFIAFSSQIFPLSRNYCNIIDEMSSYIVPTPAQWETWYDRTNNYTYNAGEAGTSWLKTDWAVIYGTWLQITNGIVKYARFPQVQNQYDFNMAQHQIYEAAPPATIQIYPCTGLPSGYLLCDGAAYSRKTYSRLFRIIGTRYGAGDGSTTFNVPNLTDKFIQGNSTPGTVKSAGLPNIVGTWAYMMESGEYWAEPTGCVYRTGQTGNGASGDNGHFGILHIEASRSSSIYGSSTTVQPPALTMRYIIKYM